jgi:Domain of unknown function (DUF4386)
MDAADRGIAIRTAHRRNRVSQTKRSQVTEAEPEDPRWNWLYKIGGAAALFGVAIIPIQLIVFIAWGQPDTAIGWFTLFQDNKLAGLLAFELLLIVSVAVGIATTLALYIALRRVDESFMVIALALGLVEAVAFMLARPTFEMLYLSEGYATATTDAQRAMFLRAGEAMLATFTGTAFNLSINLFSIYFLIVSGVMLRSNIFGRVPAYMGILAAIFNWALYIPTIGLFLSILSVFPFLMIWNILVARRLFQLGKAS